MNEGNKPIPDADTCKAAEVLRKSNVELDTPTFWLLAGLIADVLRRDRREQREEMCKVLCPWCAKDYPAEYNEVMYAFAHKSQQSRDVYHCPASAIRAKGED